MRFRFMSAALLAAGLFFASHGSAQAQAARHYDCSKAGNANKAACKGTGATPAPAAAPTAAATTTRTTTARHYDCSKPGNANKAACKAGAPAPAPSAAPPSPPAPSATATTATRTTTTRTSTATSAGGPNGATAQCNDGTYSHSAHRSGTCAGHKGVKTWY